MYLGAEVSKCKKDLGLTIEPINTGAQSNAIYAKQNKLTFTSLFLNLTRCNSYKEEIGEEN
jgi:hypothetical protein